MTIQQLQYVLEIAACGSVSKAAKQLYLSQPNLSNSIKNLESELGISIFERTPSGMRLTASGSMLAQRASQIMSQLSGIAADARAENSSHMFRVIYPMYQPAFDAFIDLCTAFQDSRRLYLSCSAGSGPQTLELLYQNLCDLVVSLDTSTHFPEFYRYCSTFNLEYVELAQAVFSVQLSSSHPLLKNTPFEFGRLKEYPYVAFTNPGEREVNWAPWSSIVNPDKLICIQNSMSRVSIVARTNAFSIVFPHAEEYNKANGVTTIPLPFHPLSFGYIYSKERGLGECGKLFVEYLEKHLKFHLKSAGSFRKKDEQDAWPGKQT